MALTWTFTSYCVIHDRPFRSHAQENPLKMTPFETAAVPVAKSSRKATTLLKARAQLKGEEGNLPHAGAWYRVAYF